MKKNMILFSLCLLVALAACEEDTSQADGSATHEVTVKTVPVEQKALTLPVFSSGLLTSDTEAMLSFKIGGIIQRIYVEEGQSVQRGQLLATLDLTEINAQVIQAQNSADKAKRDLKRIKNLYKDEAATLENVQDLTTAANVATEGLRIARFNQRFAEIRAVSNGKIVRKIKNEGELVTPGTPILYMNDTSQDQWRLEVGVADRDWARITEGDSAIVSVDAYPDEVFTGKVAQLAQGADPSNGAYKIEVQVFPQEKKFATGLFAEAKILPSGNKRYHTIPLRALVDGYGKRAFVFVPTDNNKVKKIPIEVAFMLENEVAVKKGLENVKEVITDGAGYLTEISRIKMWEKDTENLSKTTAN
ncbi:MAG: efflux RND transporter periplasmic adaptor subunit [Thermonemataceae bacterium]